MFRNQFSVKIALKRNFDIFLRLILWPRGGGVQLTKTFQGSLRWKQKLSRKVSFACQRKIGNFTTPGPRVAGDGSSEIFVVT